VRARDGGFKAFGIDINRDLFICTKASFHMHIDLFLYIHGSSDPSDGGFKTCGRYVYVYVYTICTHIYT